MSWEPRPIPDVTPETERFWKGASEGKFLLKNCPECDLTHFYPRTLCPDCFAETEWVQAEGTGEIYTYSVVHQISGWPDEHTPVIVAYIELDEDVTVFSNIVDADPETVEIGDRVEVNFVDTEDPEVAIPVFRKVD